MTTPGGARRADVELRLPADGAYASVLRTTTAGLAARLDFTIDDIEDLRIAASEASALVLLAGTAPDARILAFGLCYSLIEYVMPLVVGLPWLPRILSDLAAPPPRPQVTLASPGSRRNVHQMAHTSSPRRFVRIAFSR